MKELAKIEGKIKIYIPYFSRSNLSIFSIPTEHLFKISMALKQLLAFMLFTIFHVGLINATGSLTAGSAASQSKNVAMTAAHTFNQHGVLAHLHPIPPFGVNSSVNFHNSNSFKSKQLPLRMQHLASIKAIPRDDFGHAEDGEEHQLTADRAKKEWLYYRTMAMFREEEDKTLVHKIFSEKLADMKGLNLEERIQDPNWFFKIHFMEMPLNDVMVALAETLVQHFDNEGDVNDFLHKEIKKEVDFMKAIKNAKVKFAEKKEKAQKKINENYMASEGSMQRIPPSEQAYEKLTNKNSYTIWLYHNMMAMFRRDQESEIYEILVQKLQEGMDWKDLTPKTIEVVLAESLVDYLKDKDNIKNFYAENFSISVIVKFMAEKRLESEEKQKFMESYLHLFADNCHLPIDRRLEATFQHYENEQEPPHNS